MIGTGQYSPTVSILSSASRGALILPPTLGHSARARPRKPDVTRSAPAGAPGRWRRRRGGSRAQEPPRPLDGRLVDEDARQVRRQPEPEKVRLEVGPHF